MMLLNVVDPLSTFADLSMGKSTPGRLFGAAGCAVAGAKINMTQSTVESVEDSTRFS